ncbi:hypothetical protein ACRRVD_02190 [Candidatus Cardinium hertigii]|uniref:hypothetical protein n=1 Tax=Candidatus Cardinium hertigii TaxID=247481 RepID=UPI003D7CAD78
MAKKYICHQLIWVFLIIAIHIIGGSCDSCNRNRPSTPKSTPTPTPTAPTPIDNSDAKSSTSSGYASNRSGSASSSSSASSNFSSGSPSSNRSSSPDPATDFAGLPNTSNTCYMNAVLQIIAALYEDKVQTHNGLKDLVKQINDRHEPLDSTEIEKFVTSLPKNAQKLAESHQQQDPVEFINGIMEEIQFLDSIECIESLIFKKGKEVYEYNHNPAFYAEPHHAVLTIEIKQVPKLTTMIQDYQYELVKEGTDLNGIDLNGCSLLKRNLPTYVEVYEKELKDYTQESNNNNYITYKVFHKLPEKICIRLNRFDRDGTKINTDVTDALSIAIQPDPSKRTTTLFDLHGFIVHKGRSWQGGHYIAYVKRNGKWYEANDKLINPIDKLKSIEEKSKEAYLLFYKKK